MIYTDDNLSLNEYDPYVIDPMLALIDNIQRFKTIELLNMGLNYKQARLLAIEQTLHISMNNLFSLN